jgi:hypothetical protein
MCFVLFEHEPFVLANLLFIIFISVSIIYLWSITLEDHSPTQ